MRGGKGIGMGVIVDGVVLGLALIVLTKMVKEGRETDKGVNWSGKEILLWLAAVVMAVAGMVVEVMV